MQVESEGGIKRKLRRAPDEIEWKVLSPLMKLIAAKRFLLYGPEVRREALASESQLNVGIFAGFLLKHGVGDEAILEEVFVLP